ncbi:uncharacterized protein LOC100277519 [Zea mays]|uniref:Uncharacterized protein n=1 Tax=Zea mays TaxID=4577 RepID=B6TVR4_MAIZE|nr:uncharacterized protein LOC100277519 [Zea mays]ACG41197.1 hypothetical protein [Zea mays]|eukprot:NP_001144525.1 uncharacterized protein LOC100277519 [Zea mays]
MALVERMRREREPRVYGFWRSCGFKQGAVQSRWGVRAKHCHTATWKQGSRRNYTAVGISQRTPGGRTVDGRARHFTGPGLHRQIEPSVGNSNEQATEDLGPQLVESAEQELVEGEEEVVEEEPPNTKAFDLI